MTTRFGPAVELVDLTKTYAVRDGPPLHAARSLRINISAGSTVAITGASGSGKSTVLHLVGGMDRPSTGTVLVDGIDLATLSGRRLAEYRRSVGFVFQRFHLLPALTVRDNVLAPLLPVRGSQRLRSRAEELIWAVGLEGRERSLPSQLSGGQQQRVAIARALATQPRLLLADEPTGNLDSAAGDEILTLLFELQEKTGMTTLMATHDPQVATRCARLLRLRDGRLVDDTALLDDGRDLLSEIDRLRL